MQEELDTLDRQEAYLEGIVERLEREKTQLQKEDEEKKRKEEEKRESARSRPRNSLSSMFFGPKEGKTSTKLTVSTFDSRFNDPGITIALYQLKKLVILAEFSQLMYSFQETGWPIRGPAQPSTRWIGSRPASPIQALPVSSPK